MGNMFYSYVTTTIKKSPRQKRGFVLDASAERLLGDTPEGGGLTAERLAVIIP